MTSHDHGLSFRRAGAGLAAALGLGLLLFASAVMAQAPQTPPSGASPAPEATRHEEPGLLHSLGRWLQDSAARMNSNLGSARDNLGDKASGATKSAVAAAKDAAKEAADAAAAAKEAAKDAADAVVRLPGTRVVDARERCAAAANGAPDCRVAADAICRGKGFASGKSMEIESAHKCPARVWLSGRRPEPGDCETESYVTRAVCQ
jgi:hypothetical protein